MCIFGSVKGQDPIQNFPTVTGRRKCARGTNPVWVGMINESKYKTGWLRFGLCLFFSFGSIKKTN